ncbi:GspE/PulE family protein [Patescibacteria group bacterium]|nr:GspE/PulE family protein [Patescibacteria group bacterium]MBU1673015.1 GspE/PulE family protein [Patescibacteria group bacterium]MBU1964174.1 GspE/PulE family protein [Patescibacteria group bacterium]
MAEFSDNTIKLLLEKGYISEEEAEKIQAEVLTSGQTALAVVSKLGIMPEEKLTKAKSDVLNIPYVDLTDEEIDQDILELIPQEIAKNYELCPFAREENKVKVAMVNPNDYKAVEALDFIARQKGVTFEYYFISPTSLKTILRQYESRAKEVEEALASTEEEISPEEKRMMGREEEEEFVKTAPVSKMVSVILRDAIEGGASDIHIEPMGDKTRVRYRLDGVLHTSLFLPSRVHPSIVARIKVLSNLKLDETRIPQDGRFKIKFENRDVEFRVSTLPLLDQEKVVMRILDTTSGQVELGDLGFIDHNLEVITKSLKSPHGMILVTGPTGSGKSTTLYSMMSILNREGVNIVSLEDPVEYNIPGVAQAQVRPEVGLSFAAGLRSILRQDPDIIMVGEVRDAETAELAVHAALTGHMVLSTLHTNDAFGAIPRLIDMGVEPFLISSSLNVVVAQRLIRKICDNCKIEILVPESIKEEVEAEINKIPEKSMPPEITKDGPMKLYKGEGCSHCDQTGYRGRVAIIEVLQVTPSMEKIIAEGKSGDEALIEQEFNTQGMLTMLQDGVVKAMRGITTVEEVFSAARD